jgi:hypothetical protein
MNLERGAPLIREIYASDTKGAVVSRMCIVVAILKLPPDASCFYLPVKEAIP